VESVENTQSKSNTFCPGGSENWCAPSECPPAERPAMVPSSNMASSESSPSREGRFKKSSFTIFFEIVRISNQKLKDPTAGGSQKCAEKGRESLIQQKKKRRIVILFSFQEFRKESAQYLKEVKGIQHHANAEWGRQKAQLGEKEEGREQEMKKRKRKKYQKESEFKSKRSPTTRESARQRKRNQMKVEVEEKKNERRREKGSL